MAIHELRYYNASTELCTGSPFAFYPSAVSWEPETLGFDIHSRPILGDFWACRWRIPEMRRDSWSSLGESNGGFRQLQNFRTSGSPLCLKTTPEDTGGEPTTSEVFSNVYIAELTGEQRDINCYNVGVSFTRAEV